MRYSRHEIRRNRTTLTTTTVSLRAIEVFLRIYEHSLNFEEKKIDLVPPVCVRVCVFFCFFFGSFPKLLSRFFLPRTGGQTNRRKKMASESSRRDKLRRRIARRFLRSSPSPRKPERLRGRGGGFPSVYIIPVTDTLFICFRVPITPSTIQTQKRENLHSRQAMTSRIPVGVTLPIGPLHVTWNRGLWMVRDVDFVPFFFKK